MRRWTMACAIWFVAAFSLIPIVAHAGTDCTEGPGTFIRTKIAVENGAPVIPPYDVILLQLPGGTAEYSVGNACNTLTFTAIRNGEAVYTDDGLGRGLTIVITKDGKLFVSHIAGWIARSE